MDQVKRRLAAILAADVAGYSRLMEADEAETLARFNALRADLLNPIIAQFHGTIVGSAGDSLLVEFASAVDAVQCAVELQQRLAAANEALSADRRIVFRMGVNLGDVIAEGGTIHGDGVNVAARLEKLAAPGAVLIARAVHDQVKGKVLHRFEDLGEKALHNIAEPVRVYRYCGHGPPSMSPGRTQAFRSDRPAIAVLPFVCMPNDPEQDHFADGVTEDLTTALSKFDGLSVAARTSASVYKSQAAKVPDVGRDLGVRYVVEGSVRKSGDRLRVTVQLIEAEYDSHIWAERIDLDHADMFAAQDMIVMTIMARLPPKILEATAIRRRGTPEAELRAYDHYIMAEEAWQRSDVSGCLHHLRKSVEVDPRFAVAQADLAFVYAIDTLYGTTGLAADELEVLARRHVELALSAGVRDSETHNCLGAAYSLLGEYDRARGQLDRALALNPHNRSARIALGDHLSATGQHAEGRAKILEALELNPDLPDISWEVLLQADYQARDYEALVRDFSRLHNPRPYVFAMLAAALAQLGRIDEAARAAADFAVRRPSTFRMDNLIRMFTRPVRLPADRVHWLEGFRKAGLIE